MPGIQIQLPVTATKATPGSVGLLIPRSAYCVARPDRPQPTATIEMIHAAKCLDRGSITNAAAP